MMEKRQAVQLRKFYLREAKGYRGKDKQDNKCKKIYDLEEFKREFPNMNRIIINKFGALGE